MVVAPAGSPPPAANERSDRSVSTVRTGEPVDVDIFWRGHCPQGRRYELGLTFIHSNGSYAAAARNPIPDTRGGSGVARLHIDAFPLVAGSYHVGAGVSEMGSGSVVDYKPRHARVEVTPRKGFHDDGITALFGTWSDRDG